MSSSESVTLVKLLWIAKNLANVSYATLFLKCNVSVPPVVMSQEELFLDSTKVDHSRSDARSRSRLGLLATGVVGGSLVALYAVAAPFVAPALRKVCLPFVPATAAQVENVLRVLRARSGTLVDIGSGDGRIVSVAVEE